jgi:hypothetical protein
MATDEREADAKMDVNSLYREEMITDRKVGMIRRLVPIKSDGTDDPARATQYVGQAEIMTNMGPLPISFDIPGTTLADAVAGFPQAATEAVERTVEQLQEMRRQQASQLVVPQGGMPNLGGAGGPGGLPGGGKIRMP